jgi:hypothetical protein
MRLHMRDKPGQVLEDETPANHWQHLVLPVPPESRDRKANDPDRDVKVCNGQWPETKPRPLP